MKKALMILGFTLFAIIAFGQAEFSKLQKPPVDSLTGKVCYSEDVSVLSDDFITSKEELFSRALSWFKHDFPAKTKCIVQFQDKEAGKVVAKDLIHSSFGPYDPISPGRRHQHQYIEFTISILVRDGGYKFVMTDFNLLNQKVGSQIDDHGFPENLTNKSTEGVDSVRSKTLKNEDYNLAWEMIASTARDRIQSLKKAMANESGK